MEAKCSVCDGGFNFYDLYCMLSGRGANSYCKDHREHLICMKCGGFDKKDLKCPHCRSSNITQPRRTAIGGKSIVIRECASCLNILEPDGHAMARKSGAS